MTSDYMKDYNKQYYQEHKEYYYESAKKWRLNNTQKRKEQAARYYQRKKQERNKEKLVPFNQLAQRFEHQPIKGFQNEYEAFENGAIWSWKYYMFKRARKGKDGYYKVGLMTDSKNTRDQMVSRLVASAFDDRTFEELKELDVHHCNMEQINSIENLVYLPHQLHLQMHNKLTQDQIKSIGEQVKHLRGSAKTNKFVELVESFL